MWSVVIVQIHSQVTLGYLSSYVAACCQSPCLTNILQLLGKSFWISFQQPKAESGIR